MLWLYQGYRSVPLTVLGAYPFLFADGASCENKSLLAGFETFTIQRFFPMLVKCF